jgi:hypothetical protein
MPNTIPLHVATDRGPTDPVDSTSDKPAKSRRDHPGAGLTVSDVAARYRVSPDKVRAWIHRGELSAINTASALCGKPRFIVLPAALEAFERGRLAGPPPKPPRRPRRQAAVDYYP